MTKAQVLRQLLHGADFLVMPCCYDGLSAKLIEAAGFPLTFMSGFSVAAARFGLPDTGLVTVTEMVDSGRAICSATTMPVIGDGDTGHGNALNVKRTVQSFADAGFAGIMIEDQVAPKRCGHTQGKQVVDYDDAVTRFRAAVDARQALQDQGRDIVLMARSDARTTHGPDEALRRMEAFAKLGADILFLEAPESEAEMQKFCDAVPGVKMANLVEQGKTPELSAEALAAMGYKIAAHPLTLLLAQIPAINAALTALKNGQKPTDLASFDELKKIAGFEDYWAAEKHYASGDN